MTAAALGSGCGGDEPADRAAGKARGVGEMRVGSVAALAQCSDWNAGSRRDKLATIDDIRRTINLRDTPTPIPALTDAEAQGVFDRACKPRYAAGFRLYKLYARAAAFQNLPRPGVE